MSVLYKYRSLEDEDTLKRVGDILLKHRLYSAKPSELNDPIDCKFDISFEASDEQRIQRAMARVQRDDPKMPAVEARLNASSRLHLLKTYGRSKMRRHIENIGVASLATCYRTPSLWKNYADNHSGICIEFSYSSPAHASFFGNALPVTYYDQRKQPNFMLEDPVDYVQSLLLSKTMKWSYEAEYRILNRRRSSSIFIDFDPAIVSRVYLGSNITQDNRDCVKKWILERESPTTPKLIQVEYSPKTGKWRFEGLLITDR